jgi:hypothetical protein
MFDLLQHVATRWLGETPTKPSEWELVLARQSDEGWHVYTVLHVCDVQTTLTASRHNKVWQSMAIDTLAARALPAPVLVVEYNQDLLNEPMVVITFVVERHWEQLRLVQ